jgi:hypothetical protein
MEDLNKSKMSLEPAGGSTLEQSHNSSFRRCSDKKSVLDTSRILQVSGPSIPITNRPLRETKKITQIVKDKQTVIQEQTGYDEVEKFTHTNHFMDMEDIAAKQKFYFIRNGLLTPDKLKYERYRELITHNLEYAQKTAGNWKVIGAPRDEKSRKGKLLTDFCKSLTLGDSSQMLDEDNIESFRKMDTYDLLTLGRDYSRRSFFLTSSSTALKKGIGSKLPTEASEIDSRSPRNETNRKPIDGINLNPTPAKAANSKKLAFYEHLNLKHKEQSMIRKSFAHYLTDRPVMASPRTNVLVSPKLALVAGGISPNSKDFMTTSTTVPGGKLTHYGTVSTFHCTSPKFNPKSSSKTMPQI